MSVKTRAELKSENASDFPDNVTRLISPADLRGQMDDVADSAILAEDLPGLGLTTVVTIVSDNSYTLTAADSGTLLYFTSDQPIIVTVPVELSATFSCRIVQGGFGQITLIPAGTVINSPTGYKSTAARYVLLLLTALQADVFLLSGDVVATVINETPVNTDLPIITVNNFTLTATPGIWTNNPAEYRYQWLRNVSAISGAEGLIYNLTDDDVGELISVTVTAVNQDGEGSATSLPYGPVQGAAPVNTVAPTITGGSTPPTVGQTLIAAVGTWTGIPMPTLAFQWRSAGVDIPEATQQTYRTDLNDLGDLITLRITATNSVGSASVTSVAVGPVAAGTDVVAPVLSALSVEPNGETAAFLSVTTDEGDGTFYWVVQPDGLAAPSATQVKAGLAGTGAAASSSGSFPVVSIDTWGSNPAGLSAGTTYDAYGVMYDASGNASNVVTDQFVTAGGVLPVLTTQSAADFSDVFVWVSVSTNNGTGTLYVVVVPADDPAPTAAQIEAGTNSAGVAAPAANLALAIPGTKTVLVRGLTASTSYRAYIVQEIPAGYSNIVNAPFMSDVLVAKFADAGTIAGITNLAGSAFTLAQPDPFGGANAINWHDVNDSVTNTSVALSCTVSPFFNGINKVHFTMKHHGSPQWMRVTPGNIGAGNPMHCNVATGAIGAESWLATPVSFDVGSGWWMFSGADNNASSDLFGVMNFYMADANGSVLVSSRNGTCTRDVYNIRITRAS